MNTSDMHDIFAAVAARLIASAQPRVAVAVSGGADSLALTLLLQKYLTAQGGSLIALTVDHGLRSESASEAEDVAKIMQSRGIAHRILRWDGVKPASRIQERARQARYDLLVQACRDESCAYLATAHHAQDQMETFWMRLAHGSGLDGLAGMAPLRLLDGIAHIRPLLLFDKESLRDLCRAEGVAWVEDPSNANETFLRPRLRAFEETLAQEGLTPQRLTQTLHKLQQDKDALDWMTSRLEANAFSYHPEGHVSLQPGVYTDLPTGLRLRLLQRALKSFDPRDYAAPYAQMESLDQKLLIEGQNFSGMTLAGTDIFAERGQIIFAREVAAAGAPMPLAAGDTLWDRRWCVTSANDGAATVQALGEGGWQALKQNHAKDLVLMNQMAALPYKVRLTLPCLVARDNIISLPSLNWGSKDFPCSLVKA